LSSGMSKHFAPESIDSERKLGLRIGGAIAVEPSGERFATKGLEEVMSAACGESREVALYPIFDGRLVCRMGPR